MEWAYDPEMDSLDLQADIGGHWLYLQKLSYIRTGHKTFYVFTETEPKALLWEQLTLTLYIRHPTASQNTKNIEKKCTEIGAFQRLLLLRSPL